MPGSFGAIDPVRSALGIVDGPGVFAAPYVEGIAPADVPAAATDDERNAALSGRRLNSAELRCRACVALMQERGALACGRWAPEPGGDRPRAFRRSGPQVVRLLRK